MKSVKPLNIVNNQPNIYKKKWLEQVREITLKKKKTFKR